MSKEAAKLFANEWYEGGGESGNYQIFWLNLLRYVFEIERPDFLIEFQKPVDGRHIDAYIAKTKVIIEHKSFGVDLTKKILQSDGELLTPFEQAKRYADALPANEKPRWIVTCNFSEFRIYNLTKNFFETELTVIKLRDLRYQFPRLKFLIDPTADDSPPEEKISKEALGVITKIYEAFAKNYQRNKVTDYEDDLNKICTRLVFCLYAGDAHLFDANQFFDYLKKFSDDQRNTALQNLFDVLNTPEDLRGDIDDDLKNFPYVNGGLFSEKIPFPEFNRFIGNPTDTIGAFNSRKQFSWHEISPPIFGAMFESTFSKENRQRSSGMFYTSVENIHKIIDPLFLDDLRDEFELAKRKQIRNRAAALISLQDKISKLQFLDPACGSGNFLTETYLSLRRLENEILEELRPLIELPENPIKVSINQFYGIEINSFAVAVAQTALWIAENQMLQETEGALGKDITALPLKNFSTIIKANALRVDWHEIFKTPNSYLLTPTYIIGNPPFVGGMMTSAEQTKDLRRVWGNTRGVGEMDYVSAWYRKASDFIQGTNIRCAFVSTNSITQGQQACTVWKSLLEKNHIDFAHRTFKWLSDSENMAHVHCVVVGFSNAPNVKPKKIFDDDKALTVSNINQYLLDAPTIFIEYRSEPICPVPPMRFGSMPRDGGGFIIAENDLDYFLNNEPAAEKYIRPYLGADEFIKGKKRYCLWFDGVPLDEIKKMPLCWERVEAVKNFRLLSKAAATRKFAETPHLFCQIAQPTKDYILIPRVSSENRKYIPMGFLSPKIIASDATLIIPDAEIYHFGILTSSIHMAWMRTVAGRLESRYRYSKDIVYNNFPWCEVTARQRRLIERSAQNILDVRKDFPDWTFAKLYDETTMPDELRSAHKWNDFNVALAYGFENFVDDEAKVVAELMKLYKALTS